MDGGDKRKLADIAYERRSLEHRRGDLDGFDASQEGDERAGLRRNLLALLDVQPGASVLDYGSGAGEVCEYLALTGVRPVGVDMFPGYVRLSHERASSRGLPMPDYTIGDCERLPFRDGVFDGAFCSDVLHHVPDPVGGASEILRTLKPGGTCVVVEPNALSPLRRLKELAVRRREHIIERSFYPWELVRIFRAAGFAIERRSLADYKVERKRRGLILRSLYRTANGPLAGRVLNPTLIVARKPGG